MFLKIAPLKVHFSCISPNKINKSVSFLNLKPLEKDTVSFGQKNVAAKPVNFIDFDNIVVEEMPSCKINEKMGIVRRGLQLDFSLLERRIGRFSKLLRKYENVTLHTPGLRLMQDYKSKKYDLPDRFAIVANNTIRGRKDKALVRAVPEMFEGLDMGEVAEKLNLLRLFLDTESENVFNIGGKKFRANYENKGQWGKVYKIEDDYGNNAALKIFNDPNRVGPFGSYGETAVFWEASKRKISNIPEFYMANPTSRDIYINGEKTAYKTGGWLLSEFVTKDTPLKKSAKDFYQWCEDLGLRHTDGKKENLVGSYLVDLGGIANSETKVDKDFYIDLDWFVSSYPYIKDTKWYINAIQDVFQA